jgi:drug/metabolite transporter (DMT)-like permease
MSLLVVRFIIAALLFLPIAFRGRRSVRRAEIVTLIPAALLGMVGYYVPVTFGVQQLSASTAGLILAMEPGWILLAAVLLGAEKVRALSWIGVGVAFCGVALLFVSTSAARSGSDRLLGEGLVLLGGILFAAYTIYVRRISYRYGALNATAMTTLLGTVPFLPFIGTVRLPQLAALGVAGWIALALLAVGSTVVATILWNRGVVTVGGAGAGPYLNAVPLVSVLGGYILLGERLPALTLISGALIVGGLALNQLQGKGE